MLKNHKIRIADVSISIEGDAQTSDWDIVPAYRPFIALGETDIRLRLHQGVPDTLGGEKVFDCPPIWTLYRQSETSVIKIFDALPGLERTLVLPRHLEKTDLYFADKSGPFLDPFYGPTMELLMVNYLAQGRGVILHSCAIARNGGGILFVGESGAGKSTLARMWDQENAIDVVSDDRTIVRKRGQQFWMYGTPWHGDAKFASPRGVRLERIFFLRHGEKNTIREIKGINPVSKLLTCSFPPFWDPQGMAFTLEVFTDLSAQVPCQELAFKPETRALDLAEMIAK
jgi:energy-coupling factor transporter ATP-binding protein EcfA2